MPELVLSPSLDLTPWRGESTGVVESPMSPVCVKIANGNTLGSVPRKGASQPTTVSVRADKATRAAKPVASVGLVTGMTRSRLDMGCDIFPVVAAEDQLCGLSWA